MTLISFSKVDLSYGHRPLLHQINFSIHLGERIGLIGRNGTGKSSLLHLLQGNVLADDGEILRSSHLRIALVEQEPTFNAAATIFDTVCNTQEDTEDWQRPSRIRGLLKTLNLKEDDLVDSLSGGMRKRVALACALSSDANLLLLDEPTNHLDIEGITWLENALRSWQGSAVIVTHDRRFLDAVTTAIIELDRGKLLSFPGNFSQWQVHKMQWLEAEQLEQARFNKLLAQEEKWIRKGIEARRTRNEGRVRRLEQLRVARSQRRERIGNVNLNLAEGQRSGKLVAELNDVSHRWGEQIVVNHYTTSIWRGDRIGIIGPNGVGKTTLLKLILGELTPNQGTVRLGTHVSVAYLDQMRSQLNETASLIDVISPGSEWIEINGTRKHVASYLEDFLFSPSQAHSPISTLSGGERARLLLARLFAHPANVLVLDEPTNDLDIETLELLEALLQDYSATVLLVSHDRAFLNNVVTQTIAYEGAGDWHDYAGDYDDWCRQSTTSSSPPNSSLTSASEKKSVNDATSSMPGSNPKVPSKPRLSNWEQKELEELPNLIAAQENELSALNIQLGEGHLYQSSPNEFEQLNQRLVFLQNEVDKKFARWEYLEKKRI